MLMALNSKAPNYLSKFVLNDVKNKTEHWGMQTAKVLNKSLPITHSQISPLGRTTTTVRSCHKITSHIGNPKECHRQWFWKPLRGQTELMGIAGLCNSNQISMLVEDAIYHVNISPLESTYFCVHSCTHFNKSQVIKPVFDKPVFLFLALSQCLTFKLFPSTLVFKHYTNFLNLCMLI